MACPSSWCPTRGLGYPWKRGSSVLRRWSWPLRHAPQPVCVDAGAGLASKAWTTSSSQLQMVKSSGNPTTTSLVSLSTNSTWKWASPERCHHGKHVCALRWHVHSHSDLHRGQAGHIESLFLSLDLLTGMMLNRKHPFWRQFPVVHKKVFQCDPLVTPESIRAGQTAAAEAAEAFFFRNTWACLFFRRTTH